MDKIPMTPSGHVALTEEYRRRTAEDRPRIIRDISEARAHGDLSRKRRVSRRQGAAEPQRGPHPGARVDPRAGRDHRRHQALRQDREVRRHGHARSTRTPKKQITYSIVGDPKRTPAQRRISISSPLARAMIGKEQGDSIEVAAPGGARGYEILKVKY